MRLRDGPRHRDADRDRHTLGHSHAVGHSHSPQGLHGHLSALTLNLLLTRSGGGMAGRRANSDSRSVGERSNGGQTSEEELRISLSLGLSVSLALGDPGGEGVKAESTDQRSNSSGGGGQNGRADRRANSVGPNTIKSSNTRGNTRGNTSNKAGVNNSSGGNTSNSHGGKLGSGDKGLVGDHLALDSHLGLELGADLGDDVPALLGEAGLGHGLGLSSALLGLCALLLGGALLLGDGPGHVLALGLGGAHGLVSADLLSHGVADLLGHLLHNVGALLLTPGGALLLGHLSVHSGALLLSVGAALLPGLCPGLGHGVGGAHALGDSGAGLLGDGVIHSAAHGGVVAPVMVAAISALTIARVSLRITQSQPSPPARQT